MKKTKSILAIFLISLILNACGSVAEGLSGSKKKGSEEFLVEKKAPLVLPPSYGELPKPGTQAYESDALTEESASDIEEMINANSSTNTSNEKNDFNNPIEKSIIDKINEQ